MMHRKKLLVSGLSLGLMLAIILSMLPPITLYAQDEADCAAALPPQLSINHRGQVIADPSLTLNILANPLGGIILSPLFPSVSFTVIDGPVCVNGIYWWQIDTGITTGWIPESDAGVYVVAPILPDAENPFSFDSPSAFQFDWAAYQSLLAYELSNPLEITPPDVYAGNLPSLPIDLSAVSFVNETPLTDAQKALLAQNGFVVVSAGLPQFEYPYTFSPDEIMVEGISYERPYFVTTDGMYHALYYIFSNLLSDLEQYYFYPALTEGVIQPLLYDAHAQREALADTDLADAAHLLELYLAVAAELFYPQSSQALLSPEDYEAVLSVVALADAAEGIGAIPFLNNPAEDFSLYRPRGSYAGDELLENYFRGMTWLGRITLSAKNSTETQAALLLAHLLQNNTNAALKLQQVHETLSFLIGPVDDLSLVDYQAAAASIYTPIFPIDEIANPELLTQFISVLEALPASRINGLNLLPDTDDDGKGFRLLGQRFTLDSWILEQLVSPQVGDEGHLRLMPQSLDIAAVLGSEAAQDLLNAQGMGEFANYDAQLQTLQAEFDALDTDAWLENIYSAWLWSLDPLAERASESYPPLMNTEAWQHKDLQTLFASWTELKHATVLYVKQPGGGGGGGSEINNFGYVEPNPIAFARIATVAAATYQGLFEVLNMAENRYDIGLALSVDMVALEMLVRRNIQLAEIANKELHGEELGFDDYWLIYGQGEYYRSLLRMLQPGVENPDPVALVTDVFTDLVSGQALHEAIGNVDYIYVVIPDNQGGLQLARGGVYSYYEFPQAANARLTDAEWRAMLDAGEAPARPTWTSSFIAE